LRNYENLIESIKSVDHVRRCVIGKRLALGASLTALFRGQDSYDKFNQYLDLDAEN